MEQRTCNIIICCKGYCQLDGPSKTPMEAIAAYMSNECACPKEDYKGALMESILREAMFDYIASVDKPGYELRNLFYHFFLMNPACRNVSALCFSSPECGTMMEVMPTAFRMDLSLRAKRTWEDMVMTNLDKIRSMSSEDMASFLRTHSKCPYKWCPGEDDYFLDCVHCWSEWLNQEAE